MLQLLIFILFVFGYTLASAQDYVVTLKGDTLLGEVKYFSGTGSSNKYIRLTPPAGKKTNYQILETKAFRIENEIYHTVKLRNDYTYMKLIASGYLNLYSYQVDNQTGWDGRYLLKKDASGLDVPNLGFKKRISQFMSDCPDVVNKIESGDLGRTNLVKLVEAYNACFNLKNNQQSIIVSKEDTWTKLEKAVTALPEFGKKKDALDMIQEIQRKVRQNETVPSFLVNGLKDTLKDQSALTEQLNQALEKLK